MSETEFERQQVLPAIDKDILSYITRTKDNGISLAGSNILELDFWNGVMVKEQEIIESQKSQGVTNEMAWFSGAAEYWEVFGYKNKEIAEKINKIKSNYFE